MKNFIDFVTDIAKDTKLGEECMEKLQEISHIDLASWFKDKGYDVSEDECNKLVENKDNIKASTGRVGLY